MQKVQKKFEKYDIFSKKVLQFSELCGIIVALCAKKQRMERVVRYGSYEHPDIMRRT
jgi:pantothenate kinase